MDYKNIIIKQEKKSPPPEQIKTEKISSNDLVSSMQDQEIDDKKQIEKLKSSNEILTELFKVFNAAPPNTLLNNEYLLEREKLKKHKKHKKKSKKKIKLSSDSGSEPDKSFVRRKKSKKKKKSKKLSKEENVKIKIKKEKYENISDDNNFSMSEYEDDRLKKDLVASIKPEKPNKISKQDRRNIFKSVSTARKITISDLKHSKILQGLKKNEKTNDNEKYKKYTPKSESFDEISLSDEETFMKESKKNPFYSTEEHQPLPKSREREFYSVNNQHRRDEKLYDIKTRRSENSVRDRHSRRWDEHDRRTRSRSRSRKRSRSRDLGIDKKRLLEIARKNAILMFKQGSLPGTNSMSQDIKDKVLMKMRYGGKTVEDLTDFCKKLSNGENIGDLSDISNGDSDHDRDGNEKAFHHPFVLKDRGPIVMNIKNATPIVPKTAEQTKTLLMQFPVSSGQHHRANESEWVPVTATKSSDNKVPLAITASPLKSSSQKNIFAKPLPPEEQQQPAFVPVPPTETSIPLPPEPQILVTTIKPPQITNNPGVTSQIEMPIQTSNNTKEILPAKITAILPDNPIGILPNCVDSIFPSGNLSFDVSSIITKRLNAMRRLQENPMDSEAMKMMYTAQKDMSAWASSKHVPGQFTGSTGVNVLSARELNSGTQAWAKRDTLTATAPVSGGMGMHLLQKMGWKPGEGLGRERNGALQPLLLEVKLDKKGLVADEEDPIKRKQMIHQQQLLNRKRKHETAIAKAQESLESKHPVSLLGELASKRKWMPPIYELVEESGLSHNRTFIFKVIVNDIIYQPAIVSNTKKLAKALAAKYCLQQMGILPT